jgi:hypothetical protein
MYLPIEIDSRIREGSDFFDLFSLSVRKKDNKWLVEISNHQISSIDNTGTDQFNSKTYGLAPLTDDQSKIAKDLLTHHEQLNANRPVGQTKLNILLIPETQNRSRLDSTLCHHMY